MLNTPPAGKASRQEGKAVKLRALPYLSLCVFILIACDAPASRAPVDAVTFDSAKRLDDFDFLASGDGKPGEWLVVDNDAGRGLARIDAEPAENHLPVAHLPSLLRTRRSGVDRFMAISGEIDQSAGILVRFRSPDDYYAARASALENNVKLYRVVAGRRETIGSMEIDECVIRAPAGPF